jgi:phage-related protein
MLSQTTQELPNFLLSMAQTCVNPTHAPLVAGCSNYARAVNRELEEQFYCFLVGQRVVILHAFIKKSQETPAPEIKLARKRMKEIQND